MMKNIELPRKVLVGEDAIYEVDDVAEELGLSGKPLVLADEITLKIAAETVAYELGSNATVITDYNESTSISLKTKIEKDKLAYVVGVGGGKILDAGKVIAFQSKIPYISVPTSASHDGIASPQASIKKEVPTSVSVHCPLGVVADTKIISKAPKRLLASGAADAISNYTAVLDWKLAHSERGEYFGDYASALSAMTAEIVMDNAGKLMKNISVLVEALISSGVAIGIAGSSRPCSGAEHMFSHRLDMICEKPALHGEQCGVGTILVAYLHGADWQNVRDSLKKCGAPITAKEMGITEDDIITALSTAHSIRDRYTILRGGITAEKAKETAVATKVI